MTPIPLIIIAGPTAVGKTDLALELAKKLNTEIVSADSMQVYQYMDIGTAKPTPEQQARVSHHLIDLVPPDRDFSVADYQILFERVVLELFNQGKIPMVVGGTGLYIRACLQSFEFNPESPNQTIREELKKKAQEHGSLLLHQELEQVDPQAAQTIHANDLRRVIRALEVYHTSGVPLSQLQKAHPNTKYRPIYLFFDRERNELYQRIEHRVDQMIAAGLVAEVAVLLERGYHRELKAMQSLGYRQISRYLEGEITLDEAVAQIKQDTRRYAKRQLTWFRKEPVDWWINLSERTESFREILTYLEGRINRDVE